MREIAPAALRYQLLNKGPGKWPWIVGGISGGAGLAGAIVMAAVGGMPALAVASPLVAAFVAISSARAVGPLEPWKNLQAVDISIVPWGLIIDPDKAPRAAPWHNITTIKYSLVSRDRSRDNELPKLAIVVVELLDGKRLQASAEEGEWLVSVTELHGKLAVSARRPPAGSLDGKQALVQDDIPTSLSLLRRADAILDSAEGRSSLGLETGGYRNTSSRIASEDTLRILKNALWQANSPYDTGPLAAILAAKLSAHTLLQDILKLILSPSPMLAAVCRASAVKLGASLMTAGSLEETRFFVAAADRAELSLWMTQ